MTGSSTTFDTPPGLRLEDLTRQLIGGDTRVPVLDGSEVPYINFDNAASTPTFEPIAAKVNEFLRWYANVHRGTGFKSQLSSWAFELARDRIAEFVHASLDDHIVLFTKNSTEAINRIANKIDFDSRDIVLTSLMEHHSNELPWRRVAHVEHIGLEPDGRLSKEDFERKLRQWAGRIRLVAITGASNVTGYINDLDHFARAAHGAGAEILVDAAQLAPHRPLDMRDENDPCHINYLVFSAHKMYAPYGVGVLVGNRDAFSKGDPDMVGGGTVDIVNLEEAYWSDLPDKEEAGTPDIVGVVALAKAIDVIEQVGWESIIAHEAGLTAYALERFATIPKLRVYGDTDSSTTDQRLGVISFGVDGVPHALVAAVLNYEYGIGVRSGCFCAHVYVKCLLGVSDEDAEEMEREILNRDRTRLPGTVRASFGIYNTNAEVDRLVHALSNITAGKIAGKYTLDKERGEYSPCKNSIDFASYFQL